MKLAKKIPHLPGFVVWLFVLIFRLYCKTLRLTIIDPDDWSHHYTETSPMVLVVWHNRIFFLAGLFPRAMRERVAVLISQSRDGEYITQLIHQMGFTTVRGSSTRGGVQALLALEDTVKNGTNAIITVDGPRGPRYTVHPGAAALSQACDAPIKAVALNASSYWQIKSWDKTLIPKPFSKVTVVFDAAAKLTATDRDGQCEEVRQRLMSLTKD